MSEHDMERIGESVKFAQEAATKAPGTHLPVKVVDLQVKLARRSKLELQEIIVGAAVALAVKVGGTATPKQCLMTAIEAAERMSVGDRWEEIAAEIRRVLHQAGVGAGDEPE